jgi:hypothetical protein
LASPKAAWAAFGDPVKMIYCGCAMLAGFAALAWIFYDVSTYEDHKGRAPLDTLPLALTSIFLFVHGTGICSGLCWGFKMPKKDKGPKWPTGAVEKAKESVGAKVLKCAGWLVFDIGSWSRENMRDWKERGLGPIGAMAAAHRSLVRNAVMADGAFRAAEIEDIARSARKGGQAKSRSQRL